MKREQLIKNLRHCRTEKEARDLLGGLKIKRINSCFDDNEYLFPTEINKHDHRANIYLNNSILDLALRVFFLLKLEGHILYIPKNTGKLNHFTILQSLFRDIEEEVPDIRSMQDIDAVIIDSVVAKMKERGIGDDAILDKLRALANTAKATIPLPPFLQINIGVFSESSEYLALKECTRERKATLKRKGLGGKRDLKDIKLMLDLCKKAIRYFDNFREDNLIVAKMYFTSKRSTPEQTYSALFNKFLLSEHIFEEPTLKEISKSIKGDARKYKYLTKNRNNKSIYENLGRNTPKLLHRVKSSFAMLESACIIIVAITTAMRSSELFTLKRQLSITKIEDGEYHLLKKTVFKTAGTERGEETNIPIPEITKRALETLSEMGEIFNLAADGGLFLGETGSPNVSDAPNISALNNKIKRFANFFGIHDAPTMHDFRHAIAFIVAYLNEREGIELVGMLLNHSSREMSKDYLGYFSDAFDEIMANKYNEGGKELIRDIGNSLRKGEALYGKQGEKIMHDYAEHQQFAGGIVDSFADIFEEGTNALLEKGHIGIIQTSMCVCVHDLTKPEKMACQKGFSLENLTGAHPIPSRCQGIDCGSSIFREVDINKIKETYIDEDLKKRLLGNRIFRESGGFENESTTRLLKKYGHDKE